MKLSIIIPVYQVEQTLRRCIDSVLSQSFSDWEMILVDDGSTDESPKICDEYVKNYDKIHVIHKQNGGLSDARNVGIEHAKGTYITFVDSDDYLGDDTLKKVMRLMEIVYTFPLLLKEAKMVATTAQGMYFYTHNPDGITVNADGKALSDLLEAHLKILPEMPDADYYAHLLNIQLDVYELTGNPPIIPILPYYSTLKLKLLHIIGIKRLCKLSKTLHSLMRRKR